MPIRMLDIAHPPMRSVEAEALLDTLLRELTGSSQSQALKVVHGHGGPAILKETIRNWAYRNRSRLRGVIPGEEYDITDATTLQLRTACGQDPDPDLGRANPGITVLWVR